MMGVETHISPLNRDCQVTVALFDNVKNCKILKQNAMAGEIKVALLKPDRILDTFQVLVAAARASHMFKLGKMTTKNEHSEVIYSLAASKNISDSFRNFGIGDQDSAVLIVELSKPGESKMSAIQQRVQGDLISLSQLPHFAKVKEIKKVYKVKEDELTTSSLLDAVVGRIASKEFISY